MLVEAHKKIFENTSIMINLWPHVYRIEEEEEEKQKGERMLVNYLKISTLSNGCIKMRIVYSQMNE